MSLNFDKKPHAADSGPYRKFKRTWAIINHRRRSFALLCVFVIFDSALSVAFFRKASPLMIIEMIILILFSILAFGFLRSVYLHGTSEQPVSSLFRIGKRFFWRQVGAYLLLSLCVWVILLAGYIIFEILDIEGYGTWLSPAHFFARALLIKLFLFVPMLIIVLDCGVRDAFENLKHVRIRNAIHLAAFALGASFLWHLKWYLSPRGGPYTLVEGAVAIVILSISAIAEIIVNVEAIHVIVGTGRIGQQAQGRPG